jgi:hypothetical protein
MSKKLFLEPFLGSLGILLVGVFTIKLVGSMAGVAMTYSQSMLMSLLFFIARFIWLLGLRILFEGVKR